MPRKLSVDSNGHLKSMKRIHEIYETKLALLKTWENAPSADPDYLIRLKNQVDAASKKLRDMGEIC